MCRKVVLKPDVGTSAMAGASTSDMSIFNDDVVSKPHDVGTSAMAGASISDISISSGDVVSQPLNIVTSAMAGTSRSDMLISSDDVILTEEDFDPTWIKSVEQEIREEFYERRIRESSNFIEFLIKQRNEIWMQHQEFKKNIDENLQQISLLKDEIQQMRYENDVLKAEKRLLNHNIYTLEKQFK
ncbi:37327_t:CDS:1 [Gigaspora margarita]|uniref:37327_t:CDS:1 n=1 Tax=Gigaspora margarita TaxID=4874 RepID=A0ABN7WGZ4_GIGMA|nr:37327_t:CDS:1 [Gigaspora margarita]